MGIEVGIGIGIEGGGVWWGGGGVVGGGLVWG